MSFNKHEFHLLDQNLEKKEVANKFLLILEYWERVRAHKAPGAAHDVFCAKTHSLRFPFLYSDKTSGAESDLVWVKSLNSSFAR